MQYLGGKARIAKSVALYLETIRRDEVYFEPFVGAANVICRMSGKRVGSDVHPDLIMLLQAVRDGTELPDTISEEEYYQLKKEPPSALRGLAGFGCSFGGKWYGGYARSGTRNYCKNAKNSLLKKKPGLQGVDLLCRDYRTFDPIEQLVYMDPPYKGTTGWDKFNHVEFWDIVRKWSSSNKVFVSEYTSPPDFKCVLEIETKTDLRTKDGKEKRIEKLFQYSP